MNGHAYVIPRDGPDGPELYVKADGAEHVIPLRPGMVANLLDFCTEIAGRRLRGEVIDRVAARAARVGG